MAQTKQDPVGHDSQDETPDPRRWKALSVCLVGGFMVLLDVSIVNVALPSIRDGLQASESELQWVVSGYALTFGLLLVPAGRFAVDGGMQAQQRLPFTLDAAVYPEAVRRLAAADAEARDAAPRHREPRGRRSARPGADARRPLIA